MATTVKITPEEFAAMGDAAKGFDLVDGELEEIPMSKLSSVIASRLHGHLWGHVEAKRAGMTFTEGTAYRCFPDDPDRIRKADVSFIVARRLAAAEIDSGPTFDIVPDIVSEVISPSDTVYGVAEKRAEWLGAGVKLYWEIDPVRRTVHVYTQDFPFVQLRPGDTLTGGTVLPEFAVPVAALFELL